MAGILETLDDAAAYWQDRASKQTKGQRLLESVHPLYAMGSAMGGVRAAAQQGDKAGIGLNVLSAMPTFAWARAGRAARGAQPFMKGADALPQAAVAPAMGLKAWKKNVVAQGADNAYSQE